MEMFNRETDDFGGILFIVPVAVLLSLVADAGGAQWNNESISEM